MVDIDVTTLSDSELEQLARRLEARASSVLLKDQPAMCADMATAALVIRFLLVIRRQGGGNGK